MTYFQAPGHVLRLVFLCSSIALSGISMANERGVVRKMPEPVTDEEIKIAIIVGVDEYDHLSNLNYAEADAKALASLFKAQGYMVETILGFEAYGNRLINRIREYNKLLGSADEEPQGSLVFTFSGHGFNNEQENFLATPNTNIDNLEETAIRMSEVTKTLKELNVRKRILFIDACRNNPDAANRSVGEERGTFIDDDSESEGLAIMYSTAKGSLSWEDPSLGMGVFTHYVVEGLGGAASGEGSLVNFDSLHKYVVRHVKRHVFEKFRKVQTPYRGGEWSGEFILTRNEGKESSILPVTDSAKQIEREPVVPKNLESVEPESEFDFLEVAANLTLVRKVFCEQSNSDEGQKLKKQANTIFFGKYQYRGKRNEEKGWSLYLESMRHCSTAALMDISKTLHKRNRCDIAIEYAKLAADNGNLSALRLVNQLNQRMNDCAG